MKDRDLLYGLLPEFIRYSDQESGQALQALMEVLEIEYRRLHHSMHLLYDDWFIETCQSWLVTFLGDLVGLENLDRQSRVSYRPLVGKAVSRRRYKGTTASLENAVRDATGWGTHVTQSLQRIGWSQDVDAVRRHHGGFADLRRSLMLQARGTPFDRLPRTVDVRRVPAGDTFGRSFGGGGILNLPVLEVYCWRLQAFPVWRGGPCRLAAGCYTFDPFGQDVPLFIQPADLPQAGQAARPLALPLPLGATALALVLDKLRRREVTGQDGRTEAARWLQIFDREHRQVIPLESLAVWDLSSWRRPGGDDVYTTGRGETMPFRGAIDPERGRLTLAQDLEEDQLLVSYSYGMAGDWGGGPYHRRSLEQPLEAWRALVITEQTTLSHDYVGPPVFSDLAAALAAWPADRPRGHLRLLGSGRLQSTGGPCVVDLRGRHSLLIEASEGSRPVLVGDLAIQGHEGLPAAADLDPNWPQLQLGGLWLDGCVSIRGGLRFEIDHCTLGPPLRRPLGRAADQTPALRQGGALRAEGQVLVGLVIHRSILGPLRLPASGVSVWIADSVIDGAIWQQARGHDALAIGGPGQDLGPPLTMERCTVLGAVYAASIEAIDVYFTRLPRVDGSQPHRCFHCFLPPEDVDRGAGEKISRQHCLPPPSTDPCCLPDGWEAAGTPETWLSSCVFGDPGYAQISAAAPDLLFCAGTEGSAIGVTHCLFEAERLGRLPSIFETYLRWGMQAQLHLIDGGPPHFPSVDPEDPR